MRTTTTLKSSGLIPVIDNLNFDRIKHKLMVSDDAEKWTIELCDLAEREYKRYLMLIKMNPKCEIVPTKLMDKFWHQHILDTVAYHKDCMAVFGYFVHHFPYFGIYGKKDQENLSLAFEKSQKMYQKHFGEKMENPQSSRCSGHACHVESECACRVSGACKNE
jgi:hypothetical protein